MAYKIKMVWISVPMRPMHRAVLRAQAHQVGCSLCRYVRMLLINSSNNIGMMLRAVEKK